MKKVTHIQGLLERISRSAGCTYLSDLRCLPFIYSTTIIVAVRQMADGDYTLEEWNEAVCYITGSVCGFRSVEEAVTYLEGYLSR